MTEIYHKHNQMELIRVCKACQREFVLIINPIFYKQYIPDNLHKSFPNLDENQFSLLESGHCINCK